jgi:hypothetical protein
MRSRLGRGCAFSIQRLEGSRLRVRQMRALCKSNEKGGIAVWRGCAREHAHEPVRVKLGCGERVGQRMSLKEEICSSAGQKCAERAKTHRIF